MSGELTELVGGCCCYLEKEKSERKMDIDKQMDRWLDSWIGFERRLG